MDLAASRLRRKRYEGLRFCRCSKVSVFPDTAITVHYAAAHMLLMAHALGLGAVWLSETKKTARAFKEQYGLVGYIEPVLHLAVGWPATGLIKSQKMLLPQMLTTNS